MTFPDDVNNIPARAEMGRIVMICANEAYSGADRDLAVKKATATIANADSVRRAVLERCARGAH